MKFYLVGFSCNYLCGGCLEKTVVNTVNEMSHNEPHTIYYGGDSGKNNIICAAEALHEAGHRVVAIQTEKYTDSVPKWVDEKIIFPDETIHGKLVFSGINQGEPVGALKKFIDDVINEHEQIAVIALGGGKIALEEVRALLTTGKYAHARQDCGDIFQYIPMFAEKPTEEHQHAAIELAEVQRLIPSKSKLARYLC